MKRFGRNQRRKLREQIATLEEKLYGPYQRASGRFPELRSLTDAFLDVEITDYDSRREKSKEAVIEAMLPYSGRSLLDHRVSDTPVEFEGFVWRINEIAVQHDIHEAHSWEPRSISRAYIGGPPAVTIKLVAEPNRQYR